MNTFIILILFLAGLVALAWFRVSLKQAAAAAAAFFLIYLVFGDVEPLPFLLLFITAGLLVLLSFDEIRIKRVTGPLFNWYRQVLPSVSATEQAAIDAGTVWWEGELFRGSPDWGRLLDFAKPRLSAEEQAFIDGPVEQLCRRVNAWEINFQLADIPPDVVQFIKDEGFLGMIIPREYGGLDLSPVAQVAILSKIFSTGSVVGNFISVPNSLGPGELLVKYGTEEQKRHYLPRLASGEDLPCFALTAPLAGSDATSIPDTGVVCRGQWQGEEIIGMRLNINKRYITLAPVATLVGLAFKLQDPDHLIGEKNEYGITCALLPRDTPGLEIGGRHYPIGDPFLNGPIRGKDIFVPLDYIIGGTDMAGHGWRMLVECLSTGRAISLPTISNCIARNTLASTGAYARIRRQFGLPIAEFEGVQKPLARIAGFGYIIHAATFQTANSISLGAKPAVPASILKYHCTEMARQIINDGMDIQAGKAVMKGPGNTLYAAYESVPVAITVEGANIMTRSLMIFGQGAIRCHPYVLQEMKLASDGGADAVTAFDAVLRQHAGNALRNAAHAFTGALTGSAAAGGGAAPPVTRHYYRHLSRLSAAFAIVADVAMLSMQASLKKREMISGRLGDLLSMLYLASMVLKQYEDDGAPADMRPVLDWCCQYLMYRFQQAMAELLDNLPNRPAAWLMKITVFPLGRHFRMPADSLERRIAGLVTRKTAVRDRLIAGIYLTPAPNNPVGNWNAVLELVDRHEPLIDRLRKAVKARSLPDVVGIELIDAAERAQILSADEASQMCELDARIMEVINVDEFEYDAFRRPGAVADVVEPVAGDADAADNRHQETSN